MVTKKRFLITILLMSGYCDSNTGPSGPKPDALANCATPRIICFPQMGLQIYGRFLNLQIFLQFFLHFCIFANKKLRAPSQDTRSNNLSDSDILED